MKENITGEILEILSWLNEINFKEDLDDEEAFVYDHYLDMLGRKVNQYRDMLNYKE